MILTGYEQVMERIELSAEARERILGNIQNMDIEPERSKVIALPQWKRYAALAACLAVVLLAAIAIPRLRTTEPPDEQQGDVAIANGIVELDSAEELSEALGFTMPELTELPFTVDEIIYASYWGEMGQITYYGDGQDATFRVAVGSEDISGDYGVYEDVREITVNDASITLKGNNGRYSLAIWENDGYSYAVQYSSGITEEGLTATILSIR